MKTRAFITNLAVTALSLAMLVSCGKDNKSSNKKKSSTTNYGYPGGTNYGNGTSLPSNWIDILVQENPCTNTDTGAIDNRRQRLTVDLTGVNVNAGSIFAGITMDGDVGVVSQQGGRPIIEIWSCIRPGMSANFQAFPMSPNGVRPVLNTSENCAVPEITALNIGIQNNTNSYNLAFYPIYLNSAKKPNYGSSLCQY